MLANDMLKFQGTVCCKMGAMLTRQSKPISSGKAKDFGIAKLQTMCKGRGYFFNVELYVVRSVDDVSEFFEDHFQCSTLVFGTNHQFLRIKVDPGVATYEEQTWPDEISHSAPRKSPLPEHEMGRAIISNIVQRYVWLHDKCTQSYAQHRTQLMELQCLRGSMVDAKAQNERLATDKNELMRELSATTARLASMAEDANRVQKDRTLLEHRIATMSQCLAEKDRQIALYKTQMDQAMKARDSSAREVQIFKSAVQRWETTHVHQFNERHIEFVDAMNNHKRAFVRAVEQIALPVYPDFAINGSAAKRARFMRVLDEPPEHPSALEAIQAAEAASSALRALASTAVSTAVTAAATNEVAVGAAAAATEEVALATAATKEVAAAAAATKEVASATAATSPGRAAPGAP